MAANKYMMQDKSKLLKEKLDKISAKLQGSLTDIELQTQEQYLFEAIRVLRAFYKSLNEPQMEEVAVTFDSLPEFDMYEALWNQILEDLTIVFSELENTESLTVANFNFMVTEANRLTARLKAVSSKVGDYILYTSNPNKDSLYFKDSFNDLSKIEIGSALLNAQECEISQEEGIITLPVDREVNSSVLGSASLVINPDSNGVKGNNQEVGASYQGNVAVILDDNPDTWFEYERVTTSAADTKEPLILDLTINLGDENVINRIRVNPNNFGTRTAIQIDTIETSLDGEVYTSIKDDIPVADFIAEDEENIFSLAPSTSKYAGQGIYSFTPRKVKYVHVVLRQAEPYVISTTSGDRLRYAIGIRDIEVRGLRYQNVGELISQRFTSTDEVRKVSIQASQNPLQESELVSIRYYISPDDGQSWYQIQPQEVTGASGLLGIPEILEFNGPSVDTITTSVPVYSLRVKIVLSRDDLAFKEGSSTLRKEIETRSELRSVPETTPFSFSLEKAPVLGSVVVVDPFFGSRGRPESPYIIGHAADRLDLRTYYLPMTLLPRPFKKVYAGGKWHLEVAPASEWMHISVGGEEWSHATQPLDNYTANWVTGEVDRVFILDPNEGKLSFGNNLNTVAPPENAPIVFWLEAERLFPAATEDNHIAKLEFPTTSNKNNVTIKRYDEEVQATQVLPRKATVIHLDHQNITDYSDIYNLAELASGNQQTFLNGREELSSPGEWSIDDEEGIIYLYTPTPDDSNISLGYKYTPVYTLDSEEWEWATEELLRDSVNIAEAAWKTISVIDEEILMEDDVKVLDLSKMSVVEGTLILDLYNTVSGADVPDVYTPFFKEVTFVDGITELGGEVFKTTERLPALVNGLNTITLKENISSDTTQYAVLFSKGTIFQTEAPSYGAVDAPGEYYVERNSQSGNYGKLRVYTSRAYSDPGTVTYFYVNPSFSENGLYSVDYKLGRIYTQRSMSSDWQLLASFDYTDFRAEYNIARILDTEDYNVDITNRTVTMSDKEIMKRAMIPKQGGLSSQGSYYLVNYDFVKETRENVSELKDLFSPVVKDYALKVLTKGRIF